MKPRVILVLLLASIGGGLGWWLAADSRPEAGGALPAGVGEADLDQHNRGVALMGRFDFAGATQEFEPLAEGFPGWLDVQVDYAIALLNRSRPDTKDLDRSLEILRGVLRRRPGDLRAHHCIGMLLLYRGKIEQALPYYVYVAEHDPHDGYAACFAGDCLYQADRIDEALAWYAKARERDPYLRSGYYGAFRALRMLGKDDEAAAMLALFKKLEDNPQARVAEIKYTRMGPHALVQAVDLPVEPAPLPPGPVFRAREPLPVDGDGVWRADADPAFAAADLDGDGAVDLVAAGALAGERPNAVLLRRGERFVLQPDHPLAAVPGVRCVLFGDVDNDGRTDAYLCRRGANQLWLHGEGGAWTDATTAAGVAAGDRDTRDGAMLDVDHDGDLDLVLLHADAPFEVLANRLDGTFMPLPPDAGLRGAAIPASGLVACDLDRDRDLDLLVLHDAAPGEVFLNDRLWRWRRAPGYESLCASPATAGLATDADADGRVEVHLLGADGLVRFEQDEGGAWIAAARAAADGDRLAVLDADGDGRLDVLVGGPAGWQLLAADGYEPRYAPAETSAGVATLLWSASGGEAVVGFDADARPVLWRPGPGRHPFVTLSFSGRHHDSDQMRSNADGLGVRVAARVGRRWTVRSTYRSHSGPGQSRQPLALGTAGRGRVDFATLLWSDGLLQTETDLQPGAVHRIEETQRQTSSCPVLFAWDGERYAFVTDLLGVGGIGFWVAPDTYAPPAPQETLLLPPGLPRARDGELVLKLGEPMEEACYLDGAVLEVVDLPPGWHVTVDDRMAVAGPAPTGALVFYREARRPARATDQDGRDVRAPLAALDHKAAPAAALDPRFIGRTQEQVLTLEFDGGPLEAGGAPVLVADGWIEYPYAQTLFASWQAGAAYEAPTVEAQGHDGRWTTVLGQYGYPAGMPRESSVPLAGLPAGTRALRVRTTQEVYWDRLAVAYATPCPEARRATLPLRAASLAFTGFARRTTAPQRLPHYDYGDRPPLWDARHQAGFYTRFGPVEELVAQTDDAVVIFGPGEEVELRFAAPAKAPPAGWTRRYVLRTTGWCKDMDLFTLDGETVGPLPARDPAGRVNPARARLHPRYQTRYESGR